MIAIYCSHTSGRMHVFDVDNRHGSWNVEFGYTSNVLYGYTTGYGSAPTCTTGFTDIPPKVKDYPYITKVERALGGAVTKYFAEGITWRLYGVRV